MMESDKQLDPVVKKFTSPLPGETLPNRDKQLGRWVQHFFILYSKQNTVTDAALKHTENLPTIDDLDTE